VKQKHSKRPIVYGVKLWQAERSGFPAQEVFLWGVKLKTNVEGKLRAQEIRGKKQCFVKSLKFPFFIMLKWSKKNTTMPSCGQTRVNLLHVIYSLL